MNAATTLSQKQLSEFLLNVAVVRPVFIWGAAGVGKSLLVQTFATQDDRDVLCFLSQSFRARLVKELPADKSKMNERQKQLAHRAKAPLSDLAAISLEVAQTVVSTYNSRRSCRSFRSFPS